MLTHIIIIAALIATALVLLLAELFLIPGTSLAAVASAGCALYAVYYAFATLGQAGGIITLAVALAGGALSLVWFARSKTLDRLALKKEVDSTVERVDNLGIAPGDQGVAVTRLALIGNAQIGGHEVEVRSASGFIDEKTPIVVTRVSGGVIYVKRQDTRNV